MELRIRDGDYVRSGTDELETLGGGEELLQRVLFRLTARRGAFPFLETLGSRLYALGAVRPPQRAAAARQYVTEALAEETGLTVTDVVYAEAAGDAPGVVTVRLLNAGEELKISVEVQ